jgi:hypothetical protein
LVTCIIESATEYKKSALQAFIDIEGASERTSLDEITQATERHDTEPTICRWIYSTLESWTIVTTLLVKRLWRDEMTPGGGGCFCLCCEAWLWTKSYGDSMMIMEMILQ